MKQFSHSEMSSPKGGRGTVSIPFSSSVGNKYEEEEEEKKEGFKREESQIGSFARPPSLRNAALLADIRAGRALVEPEFKNRREQVRWRASHLNLHALDRSTRQEAASDPGLEWVEATRSYRLRRKATPAPPLANGDNAEGGGAHESP